MTTDVMAPAKMKVMYLNNDGGGYAQYREVEDGTLFHDFATREMAAKGVEYVPENFFIFVNRSPIPEDYVLRPGDIISITPKNVDGNAR